MATTTYLSNPTVLIGAVDVSDQCKAATLTVGYDQLETTAFGDTGHKFTQGLQSVEVTLTLFNSYGAGEIEATLYAAEYTITNAFLASFTPISATVGELSEVEVTFVGGTFVRDITAP